MHKTPKWPFFIFFALTLAISTFFYFRLNSLEEKVARLENKLGGEEKISCTVEDTAERVKKSVVRVVGGYSEGSGFVIDSSGPRASLVVTNYHVIAGEPSPKVILQDEKFETAKIVHADKNADLALLQINKKVPSLRWGEPKNIAPAEELLAIGYPLGGDLKGEASVSKAAFSGHRKSSEGNINYLQTDTTFNPGISGGPLVDICGNVVGINTSGVSGLSLSISSDSFKDAWLAMAANPELQAEVEKIEFKPEESPLECVRAFYNYLKTRQLEEAYALVSEHRLDGVSLEDFKNGYWNVLDVTVYKIEEVEGEENKIFVKLTSKDLVDEGVDYKYFEGTWEVRQVDGKWKLWESNIEEVKNPGWDWFL